MIRCVAYGFEKNGWYVQTACNETHLGQECDCATIAENLLTEEEARRLAEEKSKELNVPTEVW